MPRIKAYKFKGEIVPVDKAKLSTAYRCPWTEKVYGNKADYVNHLARLREYRKLVRVTENRYNRLRNDLQNQIGFDAINDWLELHPEFLWKMRDRDEAMPNGFNLKISFLKLTWTTHASNSHYSPRDGVTNYDRSLGKPLGYPGWYGLIEFDASHPNSYVSDIAESVDIYTGTGGSTTGKNYGYNVTFFESDWPGLEKYRAWLLLQGVDHMQFTTGKPKYFA
jgi:hypothetical protein